MISKLTIRKATAAFGKINLVGMSGSPYRMNQMGIIRKLAIIIVIHLLVVSYLSVVACVGGQKNRETSLNKTENISSLGTIFASFLAASCCIGPAIFIIFGTSASFMGSLAFMEPLRPYLLGTAIIFLGFSFWKLYLKKPDCSCEEDYRARKIARGIFWVGVVAIAFSASFQSVLIHFYQ